ncbi:MAG: superoxide dismutase [Candidatus Methanoperedenaceae archaeon]|nr:superoxide dismutase [Candidatus Methanoperedenaceae archaeon]
MAYEPINYENLLGTAGFSDQLLNNHFTLYKGYVTNTNKVADILDAILKGGNAGSLEYAEMKRRFGWEFNGMRLHEYYFGNMVKGGKEIDTGSGFYKKVVDEFGSFEACGKDFTSVGAMRGIGWTILYYDTIGARLFNFWINEHDTGHPAGAVPLLIMDVFEHAFLTDYGLKRPDYINAFFKAIDWSVVSDRFNNANK